MMERQNSLDELAFKYCISLCFLFAPEQEIKKVFNRGQKMAEDDYKKTMEEVKKAKDEMQRK